MTRTPRFTAVGKAPGTEAYLLVDAAHDPEALELGTPTHLFDVAAGTVSAAVPLGSWLKFAQGDGYEEATVSDETLAGLLDGAVFETEGGFAIGAWRDR